MGQEFTNREIRLDKLPDYQTVAGHPVSTRLRSKSLTKLSFVFLGAVIASTIFIIKTPASAITLAVIIFLGLFFILAAVNIVLKQRHYQYALREKDLIYARGYIVHKTTILPFNRIQHVAVSRSLLDKVFGLSALKIYTAGGSGSDVTIPGLSPKIADRLKEQVSKTVSDHDH